MKKLVFLGLVALMLLPLVAIGCGSGNGSTTIEITLDDFNAQHDMVKNITLSPQDTLTVKLGSNPTTGYDWSDAAIGSTAVIGQDSRTYVEPTNTAIVGAPGTAVWVFTAKSAGTTTIKFNYWRSWESFPPASTLTINVTVK